MKHVILVTRVCACKTGMMQIFRLFTGSLSQHYKLKAEGISAFNQIYGSESKPSRCLHTYMLEPSPHKRIPQLKGTPERNQTLNPYTLHPTPHIIFISIVCPNNYELIKSCFESAGGRRECQQS